MLVNTWIFRPYLLLISDYSQRIRELYSDMLLWRTTNIALPADKKVMFWTEDLAWEHGPRLLVLQLGEGPSPVDGWWGWSLSCLAGPHLPPWFTLIVVIRRLALIRHHHPHPLRSYDTVGHHHLDPLHSHVTGHHPPHPLYSYVLPGNFFSMQSGLTSVQILWSWPQPLSDYQVHVVCTL